jgi:hypothetical protein
MGYPLPVQRRRRRRRYVLLLIVAAIVITITALVVRFIAERREFDDYLEAARVTATRYEALGVRADAVVAGLETANRASLLEVLSESSAEATAAAEELDAIPVPNSAVVPAGFLEVAVDSWHTGVIDFEDAVLAVLDNPDDPIGGLLLEESFMNFRVGDRAYTKFTEAMAEVDEDAEVRPYPVVVFIPVELNGRFDSLLIADRVQALEADLAVQHDVAVSDVRFDPAPAGDRGGQIVIPFSDALNVEATMTNRGNEPEEDLTARLILTDTAQAVIDQQEQLIDEMAPGESATLSFTNLVTNPGEFYELVIILLVPGDDEPESNRYSEVFFRNEAE